MQSYRIQLRKNSATFDKLNAMEEEQWILKQHEVLFRDVFAIVVVLLPIVCRSRNNGKAMYCLVVGGINLEILISHKETFFHKRPVRWLC